MGVEKVMGFFSQRLSKVIFIQLDHIGIFMGFPKGEIPVDGVDGVNTLLFYIHRGLDRLPAASDAAAGASHHFYEMIRGFALLDLIQQGFRIG